MQVYHGDGRKYAKRISNRLARRNKLIEENINIHKLCKHIFWCYGPDFKIESHNTKPKYKTRSKKSIRYTLFNMDIEQLMVDDSNCLVTAYR